MGNKGFNDKSRAVRDMPSSHANLEQPIKNERGPNNVKKANGSNVLNAKNKRQRHEIDLNTLRKFKNPPKVFVDAKTNTMTCPSPASKERRMAEKQPIVYDIGNGTKSTVKMQAISGSRFLILHKDEGDTSGRSLDKVKEDGNPSQQNASQSMVPKTQLSTDAMAT